MTIDEQIEAVQKATPENPVWVGLGWAGLWAVNHTAAYAIARGALGLVALAGRGLMMLV